MNPHNNLALDQSAKRRQHLRLLILPHVGIMGGAGIYNRATIAQLANDADVALMGLAAPVYMADGVKSLSVPPPPRPIIPAYEGASLAAFLWHLLYAPVRALALVRWARRYANELKHFDALLATASIDLPTLLIFGWLRFPFKRICIIQENVLLTGFRGKINRLLLRRVDIVISISRSWSNRAAKFAIPSQFVPNPFRRSATPDEHSDAPPSIDLLFVGGGARNKGFDLFLEVIEQIATERSVHAVLLGVLDERQKERVASLSQTLDRAGSSLSSPGFVGDTSKYFHAAKLLLLPITAPHFCRPAIEAGFTGRTFLISALPELEDFAVHDHNCVLVPSGEIKLWIAACHLLLDDKAERQRLGENNRNFSLLNFSEEAFAAGLRKVLDICEKSQ